MSNLSDFFKGIDGALLKPKFQDFTASGNFTPTQGLIDAGGYIEVFLVGGGANSVTANFEGASGGEVLTKKMYLTSTSPVTVEIGLGGPDDASGNDGTGSLFSGSMAGGVDLFASGGLKNGKTEFSLGASWGQYQNAGVTNTAGSGVFGYGAGSTSELSVLGGVSKAKPNSGQGAYVGDGGSGLCSITWFE